MRSLTDQDLDDVVGAFWQPDLDLFRVLLAATAPMGGDLAELGVLYGRSAALIGASRQDGETMTVVDLFGAPAADEHNAAENVSSYPGLERRAFEENYLRLVGELPVVVQDLSSRVLEHASAGTHRFVHVDASHLYEHVVTDIDSAKELLKPDGILVLDDIRQEHTPGVAAAAWQAMPRLGLRPFLLSPYKLYATFGNPDPWREAAQAWARTSHYPFEVQQIGGEAVLRIATPPRSALPPPHRLRRYVPPVVWERLRRLRHGE